MRRAGAASSARRGAWEPDLERLPAVVHAPRTDAIYNCHAYLTKVPVGAIQPFIEAFSRPGERVVDMFAGSGMTGLAAALAGRVAVLSDISVLGRHIATGYLTEVSPSELQAEARRVIQAARGALGALYQTRRAADGVEVEMVRTVWSFVYSCPRCQGRLVYFEHLDEAGKPPGKCPHCPEPFVRRSWPRVEDVPVCVVVDGTEGKQVEQPLQEVDRQRIARAECDPRQKGVPSREIAAHREMFSRSGLGRAGITQTRQFFSARNALALLELWEAIQRVEEPAVRAKLQFAFTAALTRASRRYQWGPKRPLNAQNQTYYIAPVYFEWNVFELFERKVDAAIRSDELLFNQAPLFYRSYAGQVEYHTASAVDLSHLGDESVDYVFTDPPFGSNLFYSDMSLFHETWLGQVTDDAAEAVVYTSGPRRHDAAERYEQLLREAFREACRVLRPGRFMSVVFGNSSGSIWALLQRALREAGFLEPVHVAILDKGQRSVKGLNSGSEGVVTVDLVLTVRKPLGKPKVARLVDSPTCPKLEDVLGWAAEALQPEEARNPSYIYATAVQESLHRGYVLDQLHYSDLLIALRQAGYKLDPRTGLLDRPISFSPP